MQATLITLVLLSGAVLAALMATLGMASAMHLSAQRKHGFVHTIFYALLFLMLASSLLSGRDMTTTALALEQVEPLSDRHPLMAVLQPLMSVFILAVCGERLITHWLQRDKKQGPALMLLVFFGFWFSTVALTAAFGAHPLLSHDYLYPLVIGLAAAVAGPLERDMALKAARNAILTFMLAGLLLVPVQPTLVLDSAYTQGLLPGLPRFAGLAPHPVTMGLLAQLGLLCLMARPYERRWLNRTAWLLGLVTLVVAQSKTAWLAFLLCAGTLLAVRHGGALWRRLSDPLRPGAGILALLGFMLGVLGLAGLLMFGEVGAHLSRFFDTPEGSQLASLTGRDRIWAIAYDEWQRNPVFGYGPGLWDERFRIAIGMPNATHGHNQFMDTLARSGAVGAVGLVLYAAVLLVLSLRFARRTQGLSLGLFMALLMRAISEVPLLLFGYGIEMLIHVLLLMVLATAAQEARAARALRPQGARGEPEGAPPRPARRQPRPKAYGSRTASSATSTRAAGRPTGRRVPTTSLHLNP